MIVDTPKVPFVASLALFFFGHFVQALRSPFSSFLGVDFRQQAKNPSSITALNAWSRQAAAVSLDDSEEGNNQDEFDTRPWSVSVFECQPHHSVGESSSDLSSPRVWLEHHPDGVYTVLRVEFLDKTTPRIWGQDFHLDRLEYSYRKWVQATSSSGNVSTAAARCQSECVLNELLQTAAEEALDQNEEEETRLFMATLLWHPSDTVSAIQVRGHLTQLPSQPTEPMVATLAVPTSSWSLLPDRGKGLADCKCSSWCRERKPLETHFRQPHTALQEIILMSPYDAQQRSQPENTAVALLEGLTSNVFVVVNATGTVVVQTAPSSQVLPGFARHLVLDSLQRLGYATREVSPTLALDERNHEWLEVFITSSVKLVVPVSELYVGNNRKRIWAYDGMNATPMPLWLRVRQDILAHRPQWT